MKSVIKDLSILDLRPFNAEAISCIERVENVRTVVLNHQNAEAFMRVPRINVRSQLIVKPDERFIQGQIEFNDTYLQSLEDHTHLVILGHPLIDTFDLSLFDRKIQELRIYGQVLYSDPRCAGAILARTERLQGQLLQMPANAIRWIGSTYLDIDTLKSVAGHSVVSIGTITIDEMVSPCDILDNINSMTQVGEIRGSPEGICALLSLCDRRLGTVGVS